MSPYVEVRSSLYGLVAFLTILSNLLFIYNIANWSSIEGFLSKSYFLQHQEHAKYNMDFFEPTVAISIGSFFLIASPDIFLLPVSFSEFYFYFHYNSSNICFFYVDFGSMSPLTLPRVVFLYEENGTWSSLLCFLLTATWTFSAT